MGLGTTHATMDTPAAGRRLPQHDRLDQARAFYGRVVSATPEQLDALTLGCAVTHVIGAFNTVPRFVITSQQGECGKTTVTDVAMMLSQNAWLSDPTQWALRSKFKEPDRLTLVVDDVGKIFGDNGLRGRSNPLYKLLAESYRKSATMSSSVDGTEESFSTYCVAFLTGLKTAVPRDILTRSIRIIMKPAPANVTLLDSLEASTEVIGRSYGDALHAWARKNEDQIAVAARELRGIHPKLYGRKRQIWGPLFAVAEVAGGDWPRRCLAAFTALALDSSETPVLTAEEQTLTDAYAALADGSQLTSAALLAHLRELGRDMYKPLSDRELAILMTRSLGAATVLHVPGGGRAKGWHGVTIQAAYETLMAALYPPDETEPEEDEFDSFFDEVIDVTEVTENFEAAR